MIYGKVLLLLQIQRVWTIMIEDNEKIEKDEQDPLHSYFHGQRFVNCKTFKVNLLHLSLYTIFFNGKIKDIGCIWIAVDHMV